MSSVAKSKARSLSNPSINMAGVPKGRRGAWEVADGVAVKGGEGSPGVELSCVAAGCERMLAGDKAEGRSLA